MSGQKPGTTVREYSGARELKYGCNPHQKPARIHAVGGGAMPFEVVNGNPGYINLLDALNAWQLVRELRQATGLPAAASFKHVSPAGAAIGAPLDGVLREVYDVQDAELTPLAAAYIRARNADPKSSFGDLVALSDPVDEATARLIRREVCDGVIAPGFEGGALEMLSQKRGGGFLVLRADPAYEPPKVEFREVFGVAFEQRRNATVFTPAEHLANVHSGGAAAPPDAVRDLVVASVAAKYTQSNSVAYAVGGQVIGVGAGQQSRVDCVRMAGAKADVWYLRQHPKVRGLRFRDGLKRAERVNARIAYIQGGFTPVERRAWEALFEEVPAPLTEAEKEEFMGTLTGVSISSDAFFPFRDNIDQAAKHGVKFVAQPGGSVQDAAVTAAAEEYGMTMYHTGLRLFHH